MSDTTAGEVERLESWQLPAYLRALQGHGFTAVTWNQVEMAVADALVRAQGLSPTATVVADGTALYIAEPDHSPDNRPTSGPIQLGRRR